MSTTDATGIRCYRCGDDLARLTLPIGRLDLCPSCGVELHVCRMCAHFAPSLPDACAEEEAEAVHDKTRSNFCEYFSPGADAFDAAAHRADQRARTDLAALFEEGGNGTDPGPDEDDPLAKARALFDS